MKVSVIIPAFNEEKRIDRCLESLRQMDFPRDAFEVILVDNGSTDRTLEIAQSFASSLNLTFFQQAKVHISALRNLGAARARGEILVFLDADCLPSRDWLNQAMALLPGEGTGIVGARYQIPSDSSWVGRTWFEHQQQIKRGEVSYVPAGDLIIYRSNFFKVGGFDEAIETNEDFELCQRARAVGLSILSFPELAVVHLGTPQTLRAFYRKERWHGTHVLKVSLQNFPSLYNFKALAIAGVTLVCLVGVLLGGAVAAISGRPAVLLTFLFALLLPSFLLSLKSVVADRHWGDLLPLSTLYLTYGVARAVSLLDIRNWFGSAKSVHRRAARDRVRGS